MSKRVTDQAIARSCSASWRPCCRRHCRRCWRCPSMHCGLGENFGENSEWERWFLGLATGLIQTIWWSGQGENLRRSGQDFVHCLALTAKFQGAAILTHTNVLMTGAFRLVASIHIISIRYLDTFSQVRLVSVLIYYIFCLPYCWSLCPNVLPPFFDCTFY